MEKWLKRHQIAFSADTANSICNSFGLEGEKADECLGLCYQLEKGDIDNGEFTGGLCVLTGKEPDEVMGVLKGMGNKEPWQMTRAEYSPIKEAREDAHFEKVREWLTETRCDPDTPYSLAELETERPALSAEYKIIRTDHHRLVELALKEGKPVPQEVLEDYPDLKGMKTPSPTGIMEESPYKYFLVFLPTEYFLLLGWRIPSNVVTVGGESFGQTSRAVTAATFEEGAIKYIESIRNPLYGWRDLKFDKFALQIHAGTDRNVNVFLVDDIIEKYVQTIPKGIKLEFFARRKPQVVGILKGKKVESIGIRKYCGGKARPMFEKAAEIFIDRPDESGDAQGEAQLELCECIGIQPDFWEVERWFSFFSLWGSARLIERGRYNDALNTLKDQEESYSPERAKALGILEDYGPQMTNELYTITKETRIALEQSNAPQAILLADKVANLQYDLAVERAGTPAPGSE